MNAFSFIFCIKKIKFEIIMNVYKIIEKNNMNVLSYMYTFSFINVMFFYLSSLIIIIMNYEIINWKL
jgi:hypothetical protein